MEKSLKRIQTGRLSLIMMIIFTVLNAIAWLFGSLYLFPYSAYTPQLATLFAHILYDKYGFNGGIVFWILISLAIIGIYLYAWKMTKTKAKGFQIALIAFALDTVLFVYSYSIALVRLEIIITIAMHGLILYHLYTAYLEYKKNPEVKDMLMVKRK